jgi:catechol 2,3-dioxygenase-like lactoylglutathione lyase family enzyme
MKFGYTILYVSDVKASVAFYEKAFGLQRGLVTEEGFYGELETGGTKLCFANREAAKPESLELQASGGNQAAPPFEVAFVTEEIDRAFAAALAAGCEKVLEPTKKPWGQTVSYVRELNGFLVEICTPVAP